MIGNDIVDLRLAKIESNIKRKGFLDKIFTKSEQILIQNSNNKENTVWDLWSRKEAAYKIWNRTTGIRKFNPIKFECFDLDLPTGKVKFEHTIFLTKTIISNEHIQTVAVTNFDDFFDVEILEKNYTTKNNGLPFYINQDNITIPISKSHHGRYEQSVFLNKS